MVPPKAQPPLTVIVSGPPRSGKTTLVRAIARFLQSAEVPVSFSEEEAAAVRAQDDAVVNAGGPRRNVGEVLRSTLPGLEVRMESRAIDPPRPVGAGAFTLGLRWKDRLGRGEGPAETIGLSRDAATGDPVVVYRMGAGQLLSVPAGAFLDRFVPEPEELRRLRERRGRLEAEYDQAGSQAERRSIDDELQRTSTRMRELEAGWGR